jgi:hypothetical protein
MTGVWILKERFGEWEPPMIGIANNDAHGSPALRAEFTS